MDVEKQRENPSEKVIFYFYETFRFEFSMEMFKVQKSGKKENDSHPHFHHPEITS